MYFVKLKQPSELARAEIKALCGTYGAKARFDAGFATINEKIPFERLVYSRFAAEQIEPKNVRGTFKIEGTKKEISGFAPKFLGKVDLTHPKNTIYIYRGETWRELWRYRALKRNFPFRHHLTLSSDLARFMVNLSGVKAEEKLLDPFCGTGGVLIEAGKIGAKCFGSDISDEMIFYAKKNLEENKVMAKLGVWNINKLPVSFVQKADAVVADLPYGRCSALHGKTVNQIYGQAFLKISKLLKKGGKAALLSNKPLKTKKLNFVGCHKIYVHRSLTRYANIFEN